MRLRTSYSLLAALVTVSAGCGTAKPPPETAPRPPETAPRPAAEAPAGPAAPTVHTVEQGETLSSIANRYGVSVDDFVRANSLTDPDRLTVGQPLIIPAGSAAGAWLWPVPGGEILSGFGSDRGIEIHRGLDIRAEDGEQVLAAWPGIVVYSGSDMRDYGKAVILDHGGGLTSLYGHNSELLVAAGDRVGRGDPIALAGKSGNATTVHCHFEVRKNAVAIDPLQFLGARN